MPGNNDYKVGVPDMETEIASHGTGFATVWKVPYTVTDGPAKGQMPCMARYRRL
jgi:hypothetical protein